MKKVYIQSPIPGCLISDSEPSIAGTTNSTIPAIGTSGIARIKKKRGEITALLTENANKNFQKTIQNAIRTDANDIALTHLPHLIVDSLMNFPIYEKYRTFEDRIEKTRG